MHHANTRFYHEVMDKQKYITINTLWLDGHLSLSSKLNKFQQTKSNGYCFHLALRKKISRALLKRGEKQLGNCIPYRSAVPKAAVQYSKKKWIFAIYKTISRNVYVYLSQYSLIQYMDHILAACQHQSVITNTEERKVHRCNEELTCK